MLKIYIHEHFFLFIWTSSKWGVGGIYLLCIHWSPTGAWMSMLSPNVIMNTLEVGECGSTRHYFSPTTPKFYMLAASAAKVNHQDFLRSCCMWLACNSNMHYSQSRGTKTPFLCLYTWLRHIKKKHCYLSCTLSKHLGSQKQMSMHRSHPLCNQVATEHALNYLMLKIDTAQKKPRGGERWWIDLGRLIFSLAEEGLVKLELMCFHQGMQLSNKTVW